MAAHTPGPWDYHELTRINPRTLHVRNRDISRGVCELSAAKWENTSAEEMEANARLIAAAPDLLAALVKCEDLLAELETGGAENPELGIARAAIRKALGE